MIIEIIEATERLKYIIAYLSYNVFDIMTCCKLTSKSLDFLNFLFIKFCENGIISAIYRLLRENPFSKSAKCLVSVGIRTREY